MESSGHAYLGIDVGGTNLKLALLAADGAVVARNTIPTDAHLGHDAVIRRMASGVKALAETAPSGSTVRSIGIGMPGDVDMANGVVLDMENLPGRWTDLPVVQRLTDLTGWPAFLINDARAFALAELRVGAARGNQSVVFVTVGTGIGGAVATSGNLHFGVLGAAGELGHIVVQPGGPQCTCGNQGCAETLANGPAIAAEAFRRVRQGFSTKLRDLAGDDLTTITPELVATAAEQGDAEAIDILDRAGRALGQAIAGAVLLISPEVVVIGGGVAQAGGAYWSGIEAGVRANVRFPSFAGVEFRPAALGYDAGVIGAAFWGRQQLDESR